MLTALEKKTEGAAIDARSRAEVASVVDDLLYDLEIWAAENLERSHQRSLAEKQALVEILEAKVNQLEAQRHEEEEIGKTRSSRARSLRESLASELWTLSKSLKSSEALAKKLEKAELALAKVPRLERELEAAQRVQAARDRASLVAPLPEEAASTIETPVSGHAPSPAAEATEAVAISGEVVQFVAKALGGKKWRKQAAAYATALAQGPPQGHGCGSVLSLVALTEAQLRDAGLSASHALLVACAPPPDFPLLAYAAPFMVLEDRVLLRTFSFLKASSVLATAIACRPLFTRVDALFGMGSTLHSAAAAAPAPAPAPPLPPGPATAPAATAGGEEKEKGVASARGGMSSMNPLLGQLAKRVSTKLSSAEIKGLNQMTERVKRLEASHGHMTEVRDDLESRLQATESVKEFLVEKLKDTELVLKRTIDAANESARQHQADTEVINFLDGRVHELELALAQAEGAKAAHAKAAAEAEALGNGRARQLEEVLQWEREKASKQELEAKSQKRLLVKEVKALRAQLAALSKGGEAAQRRPESKKNPFVR